MSRSVMIIDDHQLVAQSLAVMLRAQGLSVGAVCASGAEAVAALSKGAAPEVIVSDLYIPGERPGAHLATLRARAPRARLICLTASTGLDDERVARDAGADMVLRKHADPAALIAACLGEAEDAPPARGGGAPAAGAAIQLSPRQTDVLRGVALGRSNKQIAIDLGVSPETVKCHISELLRRFGVANRAELAYSARRNGLMIEP